MLLRAGALVGLSAIIVIAYPHVIDATASGNPVTYQRYSQNLVRVFGDFLSFKLGAAKPFLHALLAGSIYTGLLTAPLAFGLAVSQLLGRKFSQANLTLTLAGSIILLVLTIALNTPIPVLGAAGSIFNFDGCWSKAPQQLRRTAARISAGPTCWLLTAVSCIGCSFLFSEIVIGILSRLKRSMSHSDIRPQFGPAYVLCHSRWCKLSALLSDFYTLV